MSAKHIFVDTNILVYAHDSSAGGKHLSAVSLIKKLWDAPYPPAISTQVLQELYVSLSKKGATSKECRACVEIYYEWEVINHDSTIISAAMDHREHSKLSLWDALIVAAAQRAKATVLWSEDMQHGQTFSDLEIVNPLALG